MKKHHILLIDDDLDEFEFFIMALENMPDSFKCTYAAGAKEALKLLNTDVPDIIFLDMNMPLLNGWECLEQIKKIDSCRQVPVIFYSTYMDKSIEKKAKEAGIYQCMKKPILPGLVEDMLIRLFYQFNRAITA